MCGSPYNGHVARLRRLFRWIRHLATAIGFLWILITLTPLTRWYARTLAGPWDDPKGDVLIVLGGSLLEKDIIGTNSYWRAIYASIVWREGGFRHVVVSGGGQNGETIAEPMRQFLLSSGVPPQVISLETASLNTHENAILTKRLLGDLGLLDGAHTFVLLTSDYHTFRAVRAFRKAGLEVRPRPFPDVIKRSFCRLCRWNAFLDLVMETAKIGYYVLRGWI